MISLVTFIDKFKHKIQKEFDISDKDFNKIYFFSPRFELAHISTNFIFWYSSINSSFSVKGIQSKLELILEKLCSEHQEISILRTSLHSKFFNIFFSDYSLYCFFLTSLNKFPTKFTNKRVNIEYVSANPTGPLHLGHLRNGVVGDTLGNIFEYLGVKTTRYFYINDSGNQIQNLGYSIVKNYLQKLKLNYYLVDEKIKLYNSFYIDEVVDVLQKDKKNIFNDQYFLTNQPISTELINFFSQTGLTYVLKKIKDTLNDFHIHFDDYISEKEVLDKYFALSLEKLKKNDFLYQDNNITWLKTTKYGDEIDRVLIKENKTLTYIAGDICYHYFRFLKQFDYLINIWGADHHAYVKRVKAICLPLGIDPTKINFSLIQFVSILTDKNDVLKLSKRNKNVINACDLYKEFGSDILRFFLISMSIDSHIHINLNLLKIKNNNNLYFYCQYAYLRINSVLKKIEPKKLKELMNMEITEIKLNTTEQKLCLLASSFFQVITNCLEKLDPVFIHTYLIKLSKLFHSFYNQEKILNQSQVIYNKKIKLMIQLKIQYETCFKLLKIKPLEKM